MTDEKQILNFSNMNDKKNTKTAYDFLQRYQLITRQTNNLIAFTSFDVNPVFTSVNPAYAKMIGLEEKEMAGKYFFDFIHHDDKHQIKKILMKYIDTSILGITNSNVSETGQSLEFRIRDTSGSWQLLRWTVCAYEDEFLFISNDCTEQKNIQSMLHQSEHLLSKMFQISPQMITIISLKEGRYVNVNDSFLRYTGFTRDEVVGSTSIELNLWVDLHDHEKFIQCLKERGMVHNFECAMRNKSGSVGNVLLFSEIITYNNEPCVLTVSMNITDQKRRENTIQEHEQKMQRIIQGLPIPAFVLDASHKVLYWNKSLEELSSIRAEEVIGTDNHWKVFYSKKRPCLADILIDGHLDDLEKWYHGKYRRSTVSNESYQVIDFFPDFGGEGKWLCFTATTIRNTKGNLIGVLESLEDISDRKITEIALQESEHKYHQIFDSASDGIVLLDLTGKIIDANEMSAQIFGGKQQEIIGKNFKDLGILSIKDMAQLLKNFALIIAGKTKAINITIKNQNGEQKFLETSSSVLIKNGKKVGILAIVRDITKRKKTEKELEISEEKYRLVTENASDVIWTMDMDFRFTYISPSNEKMLGYSTEDALNLSLDQLLTPESVEQVMQTFGVEMQIENSKEKDLTRYVTLELNEIRADGTIIPIEVRMRFLRDVDMNPIGIIGITRDITERKRQEEALKKSEEKFLKAFRLSPIAICITRLSDGKFIEVNESLIKLSGYSRDELLNETTIALNLWVNGEDRKEVVDQLINTGSVHNHEYQFQVKNGNVLFVRYSAEIFDFCGERCVLSIMDDITQQKNIEKSLKESEEKYRNIVENTKDVIMLTNPDSTVAYLSPACVHVLGYQPEDIVGKIPEIFYSGDVEKVHTTLSNALRGISGSNFEYRIVTKDGKTKWVSHSWSPVWNDNHEMKYIVSVVRDVHESKNAENLLKEKIEELEKYKTITVNREIKMVDLKKEINELYKQLNKAPKYPNI